MREHCYTAGVIRRCQGHCEEEFFNDPGDCLREVIKLWLYGVNPAPTREQLARALQSPPVGREDLAQQVLPGLSKLPKSPSQPGNSKFRFGCFSCILLSLMIMMFVLYYYLLSSNLELVLCLSLVLLVLIVKQFVVPYCQRPVLQHVQELTEVVVKDILEKEVTQQKLNHFKWKNNGEKSLHLKEEMSVKWREIGQNVGISDAKLSELGCMDSVITEWISKTSKKYPATWAGLIKLLGDVDLNNLANKIKEAAADGGSTLYEE